MKKTLALTLALGAGLALIGCKPATQTDVIKTKTMALQATTALTLADGFEDSPAMRNLKKSLLEGATTDPNIPVATLDVLFNNGTNFSVEKTESDREGYAYLDVISFSIGDEEEIAYSLYYNLETFNHEAVDDDDEVMPGEGSMNQNQYGQDDNDDDDDNEKHYRIRGLAIVGEEEYRFMSKTESEIEDDETETELRFMLWKAEGNFIAIKQEIEIEGTPGTADYEYEEEFHYMVIENGEVVRQFKLELENEDNKVELEVRLDGVKYEVTYFSVDGKNFLKVEVEGDGTYIYEKVVTTDAETGETTISYVLQ